MWGVPLIVLGSAGLSSCGVLDAPGVKACEDYLLARLKTPSTYKRIKAGSVLLEDAKYRYQSVDIEYDAENSYGALMRETQSCYYPVDGNDVREDLVDDQDDALGQAIAGLGYFDPKSKLPTRAERSRQISAEADAIIKGIKSEDGGTAGDLSGGGSGVSNAEIEAIVDAAEAAARNTVGD